MATNTEIKQSRIKHNKAFRKLNIAHMFTCLRCGHYQRMHKPSALCDCCNKINRFTNYEKHVMYGEF